jgi:hypothetical protein
LFNSFQFQSVFSFRLAVLRHLQCQFKDKSGGEFQLTSSSCGICLLIEAPCQVPVERLCTVGKRSHTCTMPSCTLRCRHLSHTQMGAQTGCPLLPLPCCHPTLRAPPPPMAAQRAPGPRLEDVVVFRRAECRIVCRCIGLVPQHLWLDEPCALRAAHEA